MIQHDPTESFAHIEYEFGSSYLTEDNYKFWDVELVDPYMVDDELISWNLLVRGVLMGIVHSHEGDSWYIAPDREETTHPWLNGLTADTAQELADKVMHEFAIQE